MVSINHIGMYVSDLEEAKSFFEKYFEAKSNEMYSNEATGFQSYFLCFDDGVTLEIMKRRGVDETLQPQHGLGYDHLSLSVGSCSEVDRLTALLANDGYEIYKSPRVTGDGYYESTIIGPCGCMLELTI